MVVDSEKINLQPGPDLGVCYVCRSTGASTFKFFYIQVLRSVCKNASMEPPQGLSTMGLHRLHEPKSGTAHLTYVMSTVAALEIFDW